MLEVPKCGSRTLVKVGKSLYGENYLAGHLSLRKILSRIDQENRARPVNWEVTRVIRIFRHPIDRFVSGLNYECQNKRFSIDYLIDRALDGKSETIYAPQNTWCQEGHPLVETYPIHRMSYLFKDLGYSGLLWENKSQKQFSIEDVKSHKRYDDIQLKYEHDLLLWEKYR